MKEKAGILRRTYRKILYRDLDKVYANYMARRQMPKNHRKILDIGMGFGFHLIDKHRRGYECYGIDLDKSRVDKTRQMFEKNRLKAVLRVGSATKIPFNRNFFDEVVCSHVIEHVKDDKKALREIYRVMKRGATLHLRAPNKHNLHTKFHTMIGNRNPYTDRTHVREYDVSELSDLLEETGFKIKSMKRAGFFPPIGLKVYMVADHYVPMSRVMAQLGEKFPKHAAEIIVVAKK